MSGRRPLPVRSRWPAGEVRPPHGELSLQSLLESGPLKTARLQLHAAGWEQVKSLDWLGGALAPDWRLDDLQPHVEHGDAALVRRAGRDIGLIVAVADLPAAAMAAFRFIAIEPGERFRGLGGEAALGAESLLRKEAGIERFVAAVPEQRGLAVYFWLRLGYRPLVRALAPWPVTGLASEEMAGIWMARGFA